MVDNRKHPRKPIRVAIGWALPGASRIDARSRDLGLGGCFLETTAPPPFGTSVVVHIDLPGVVDDAGRPQTTRLQSTVRWTTSDGMGVQFGPMGARETAALLQLIGP